MKNDHAHSVWLASCMQQVKWSKVEFLLCASLLRLVPFSLPHSGSAYRIVCVCIQFLQSYSSRSRAVASVYPELAFGHFFRLLWHLFLRTSTHETHIHPNDHVCVVVWVSWRNLRSPWYYWFKYDTFSYTNTMSLELATKLLNPECWNCLGSSTIHKPEMGLH